MTVPAGQARDAANGEINAGSNPSSFTDDVKSEKRSRLWRRTLSIINWQPPCVRWDPQKPPVFSMGMNILFGFAGAFTVANLYYSHPILNVLAHDFNVPYETVSQIPTLAQSGYAVGLFFLCPLGDIFKRRPFVLSLVWFTATVWIGLCLTKSFAVFSAISFITAVTTVTPQLMLPLVGDLAPPHQRAAALSIVSAGNLLGILLARLLAGVVTEYTSWRNIYWVAFALQYIILILLWLFMPDYPSTNPGGLNYFKMLWAIFLMLKKHPILVQCCIIAICNAAPFTNYWTTLTFLLSGPPYYYSSLVIGLWALIGIAGMVICPFYGRSFIDRFVPLFSILIGELINLVGIAVGTYSGLYSSAGPGLQAFMLDMGLQTTQIASRSAIYAVEPNWRNRVNTAYMLATFFGQIMGTSAGNHIYAEGGWVASGSFSMGLIVLALGVCAARGPWEQGWFGWHGGFSIIKRNRLTADGKTAEKAHHTDAKEVGQDEQTDTGGGNGDLERATAGGGGEVDSGDADGKTDVDEKTKGEENR